MTTTGQFERVTQNRVIILFREELGYRYIGDWTDRPDNSHIEEELLTAYFLHCGYHQAQIKQALHFLRCEEKRIGDIENVPWHSIAAVR